MLTSYYKEYGYFASFQRKLLVHNVIKFFHEHKFRLTRENFKVIAKMITDEFETEDPSFYYGPPEKSTNPTGALFSRYNNQLVPMRRHKLIGYKNKMSKKESKEPTNNAAAEGN